MSNFTKAEVNNLSVALISCITAEEVLDKAWDAVEGKTWTRDVSEVVATAFAGHYRCKVTFANNDTTTPQFYTGAEYSRESRHDGAYKQWSRKITARLEGKSNKAAQPLDAVSAVIKYIDSKKLTKAQKAKVAAYLV